MRRDEILGHLRALGALLHEEGIVGEMYVVGGAAIALAFDERRSTRDVDAVFEPKRAIYAAAARVAAERDLPSGWLNDAVKGWNPDQLADFRAPKDPGPVAIWALVHDNRGGVEFARFTVGVE